jgi:hypothetical protein
MKDMEIRKENQEKKGKEEEINRREKKTIRARIIRASMASDIPTQN